MPSNDVRFDRLSPMKNLICVFLFIVFSSNAFGTHLMGGEITWRCVPGGAFIFTVKLYRDCSGVSAPTTVNIRVHNYAPSPGLQLICPAITPTGRDISPKGPGCPACNPNAPGGTVGAVAEWIYESAPVFLVGTPPPAGWVFTFDSCCRNLSISNLINPGTKGFTLRAVMYSYNLKNTNPCFDSSPYFIQSPAVIACTRNLIGVDHQTFDADLDSLAFEWAQPLNSLSTGSYPPPILTFSPGYTFNSPLPGPVQNPMNVPAVLDPTTGLITFKSFTGGTFVYVVKVTSYRNGIRISEVYREFQTILVDDCIISYSPLVYNTPPIINIPALINVIAGDTVNFDITATDNELMPAGPPANGQPQAVTLSATSPQMGLNQSNPDSGCQVPPCAVLYVPGLFTYPVSPRSDTTTVSIWLKWITSTFHIIPGYCATDYIYTVTAMDNFCPAPSINHQVIVFRVFADAQALDAHPGLVSGPDTVTVNQTGLTYSIQAIPGVTNYSWIVPIGVTIVSGQGTPSIQVTWGQTIGNISVTTVSACGTSLPSFFSVVVTNPVTTGPVHNNAVKCSIISNPVVDFVDIVFQNTCPDMNIFLMDGMGRTMVKEGILAAESNHVHRMDLARLKSGCYFLILQKSDSSIREIHKIVKQ
jgi:hypothetical protein